MLFYLLLAISSYILPGTPQPNKHVLFFTGGNSFMPPDIYSDFINKLKKENKLHIIKNSNKESISVLEQIYDYSMSSNNIDDIILIGHSSGCTTLLNYCDKIPNVDKCILLDPVNNNIKKDINIKLESLLEINAEKAYRWEWTFPFPRVPFIPAFKMNPSLLNNVKNYTKIEIANYGHCDILDTAFSNIMHNTVAKGNLNRDSIDEYKNFIVYIINCYINNIPINYDNFKKFKVFKII